ncbi:MAG: fibronectin type III domain-containing protein [Gammaproteobacteria bacterium]
MYSYNSNLSNPQPLSGAVLEQKMVYMFFNNISQYSSINFYCCKGIDGASIGEAHKAPVSDSSAPFVYAIDTSQFSTSGTRELYVDATRTDGSGSDSISTNFSINITNAPVAPAPGPTADVNLSWVAPSEREDNTAISLSDIAGYKIYYGTTKGNYSNSISVNDGTATDYTFSKFSAGTYYFVITTRDVDGRESQYSSVVTIVI